MLLAEILRFRDHGDSREMQSSVDLNATNATLGLRANAGASLATSSSDLTSTAPQEESKDNRSTDIIDAVASSSGLAEVEQKPLEVIPIEGEYFITIDRYDWVDNREQVTKDWIRHQDAIYLNGFPLRAIVNNLKKEYIKQLLSEFLYQDKTPDLLARRIATLRELAIQFFGNADELQYIDGKFERNVSDGFADKLAHHLKEIIFDLNIKNSDQKPKYHFTDTPELQLLKNVVKKFSNYFSTWAIEESAEVLEMILNDYLLDTLSSSVVAVKYTDLLFKIAHHGGFMYSFFTAHLQHINKDKYAIQSDACIAQSRINITSNEDNIYIEENTPIYRIHTLDDDAPDVENEDKSNVMKTQVKHVVTMDGDERAVLKIISAVDYSYNYAAREILLGEWLRLRKSLSEYANNYIHHGHNLVMVNAIFQMYPWIKNFGTVITPSTFYRVFANLDLQYQGDKILLYLGKCSPSYAETVLVQMDHYAEMGEGDFTRAVQLLQRMGRNDLANKALLPYLARDDKATKIVNLDGMLDNEKNIKLAYRYMIGTGFFASHSREINRNDVNSSHASNLAANSLNIPAPQSPSSLTLKTP